MLNQRNSKVTFFRAWADFFKNIFSFRGYTTRKGYWSVAIPITLLSLVFVSLLIVKIYHFIELLYIDGEAVRQFQLILSTNPTNMFNQSFVVEKLHLTPHTLEAYSDFVLYFSILSISSFVIAILTLTLNIRRYRDVGFSKNGLIVVFGSRLLLSIFPTSQLIHFTFGLVYFIFLCFKSKKFSSKSTDSKLKQFFFTEEETQIDKDVEID